MCTAASRLPCPAHARRHRGRSGPVLVHGCVRKNHLPRRARPAAATLRLPCAPPPALNDRTSARPPRAIYLRRVSSGEQGGQQGPAPSLGDEFALPVDQALCAGAAHFLGNIPSTVTATIVQERDSVGHARQTTSFFGFGTEEMEQFRQGWGASADFAPHYFDAGGCLASA